MISCRMLVLLKICFLLSHIYIGMSESDVKSLLVDLGLDCVLTVASVNDAESVTISGNAEAIDCVKNHLTMNDINVFWRVLPTSHAFHSSHMDSIRLAFFKEVKKLNVKPKSTTTPMFSTGMSPSWKYSAFPHLNLVDRQ